MISLKKKSTKRILRIIGIIISAFIIVSSVATKFVYDFIFDRYEGKYNQGAKEAFEDALPLTKRYEYACGENKLCGYLSTAQKECEALVVLVPGFHAEATDYIGVIKAFAENGFDVFCFDSLGHGESGGDSSVGFPQINNDLEATLLFIENSKEFDYDDIFLFGHSRGGYAACCSLSYNDSISAVISVNAVDSAMDGIMAYSVGKIGNAAYINYPFLSAYQSILFGAEASGLEAADKINKAKVPVLVVQAENDEVLSEGDFSLYSKKEKITGDNVSFLWYTKENHSGHTSILYDDKGIVNGDIIDISAEFFRQNTN